jgi:hypothetical protein
MIAERASKKCLRTSGSLVRTAAILVMICALPSFGANEWTARSSEMITQANLVNRALKGDPLIAGVKDNQRVKQTLSPSARPHLPAGCESAVSSLANKQMAGVAARCLS